MIVTKTEGPWYKKNITKERSTPLIKTLAGNSSEQQTCVGLTALIVVVLLFANFVAAMVMLP